MSQNGSPQQLSFFVVFTNKNLLYNAIVENVIKVKKAITIQWLQI